MSSFITGQHSLFRLRRYITSKLPGSGRLAWFDPGSTIAGPDRESNNKDFRLTVLYWFSQMAEERPISDLYNAWLVPRVRILFIKHILCHQIRHLLLWLLLLLLHLTPTDPLLSRSLMLLLLLLPSPVPTHISAATALKLECTHVRYHRC